MAAELPKTGVTLYSFTPDFHAGRRSLEDLMARAAELDMGPGLEIIGFQSIRGFPRASDEFVRHFRALVERHGFEPSCLDANADIAMRSDRMLTDEELYDYLAEQLRSADKLGFPAVRMQWASPLRVLERLLPLAESLDVKMGLEIHSPETAHSRHVVAQREFTARRQSAHLGFIPDFGATTRRVSPSMYDVFRAKGVSEELLSAIETKWHSLRPNEFEAHEQIGAFIELAASMGAPDHAVNLAVFAVGIHGHGDPKDWLEIMDEVVHVHAKFFHVTEDGEEPAVPLEELVEVFVCGGYRGYLSSEYEGWHWDTTSDPYEMVTRQQRVIRRVLDKHAAVITRG